MFLFYSQWQLCMACVEQHVSRARDRVWLCVWEAIEWRLGWVDGDDWQCCWPDTAKRHGLFLASSVVYLCLSHVASVHHVSDILLLHNCSWYLLLKLSSRHWPVWCTGLMMSCLFRFKFKLCLHQIHFGRCPAYLAELVSSSAENCRRPGLRSTSSSVYSKPRLRTKFAERAFSFSGPAEWNCLPSDLTLQFLQRNLRLTYFYKQAFFVP